MDGNQQETKIFLNIDNYLLVNEYQVQGNSLKIKIFLAMVIICQSEL